MLLRLTAAPLLALAPAAQAQGIDWYGRYWVCEIRETLGEGLDALTGRYIKVFNLEGTLSHTTYEAWGGIRVSWQFTQDGKHVTDLYVDGRMPEDPSGVYASLMGDRAPVAKLTLFDPEAARRGESGYFRTSFSESALAGLDAQDRWTLVVRSGAGKVLLRRALPVPGKRAREAVFERYRATVARAFSARDEKHLETMSASAIGPGTHCLLSTPETRAEIEAMSKIEDPLPVVFRPTQRP